MTKSNTKNTELMSRLKFGYQLLDDDRIDTEFLRKELMDKYSDLPGFKAWKRDSRIDQIFS